MDFSMTPPAPTEAAAPISVHYAGFWRRFLAFIIDWMIIGIGYSILLGVIGIGFWGSRHTVTGAANAAAFGMVYFGWGFFPSWLYFSLMESSKYGATLGKRALGLKVTDLQGHRISFGRATGRYFAKILSGVILFFGYIMAGFTAKKQGLHDMIAETLVLVHKTDVAPDVARNAFA